MIVYNRWRNTERWKRAWNAIPRAESFCIVKNTDGGELRTISESPRVMERPNVGMDLGAFQDIVKGQLRMPEWDWLFFVPDDWLPMDLDFLAPFRRIATDPKVGLIGARSNAIPALGVPLHCRSGGFMIRRDVARRLGFPADPMLSRDHCYALEWGSHNLMRQVIEMGCDVRFLNDSESRVFWDQGHEQQEHRLSDFPAKDLCDILHYSGTDKSSHHSYCDIYEELCAPFRDTTAAILELGVHEGKSLRAWRDYFPNAPIHGVDINPNSKIENDPRITTHITSMLNLDSMSQLASQHGPFQLIVDDASHVTNDMLTAYSILGSFLTPSGLYIIEDVQDQASIDIFKRLPDATVYDLRHVKGRYDDILVVFTHDRHQLRK